jgi:hypothetical protein
MLLALRGPPERLRKGGGWPIKEACPISRRPGRRSPKVAVMTRLSTPGTLHVGRRITSATLKRVARLADGLGDAPLAAAVAVRRLRGGAPRMSVPRWSAFRDQSIVFAIGFLWWLGWSSLIAFAFIDDALLAMVPATVAAVLMMVALTKGWLQTDDQEAPAPRSRNAWGRAAAG